MTEQISAHGKTNSVICIHDDRPNCLTGVKLAVLSLRQCSPALSIVVSCPSAPRSFIEWLSRIPTVTLAQYAETQNRFWNVKPTVLLRLLKEGYPEVIWVDSDVIAHRDVLTPLTELSARSFGATQETYYGHRQGGTLCTIAWGLKPGREMPCTVNSGVLRVTAEHVELLTAWEQLLDHPLYRRAQALQWFQRPPHMQSDQEVLTGLLGSQEFSNIPLVLLRRGIDIAQCVCPAGFTPLERITALHKGLPGLIHSMGSKPWMKAPQPPPFELSGPSLRRYYDYLHLELTPYVSVARRYAQNLDEDLQWMETSSRAARFMAAATLSSPTLQEFPLSLIDAMARSSRRWLKTARYTLYQEYCLHGSPISWRAGDHDQQKIIDDQLVSTLFRNAGGKPER